MPLTLLAATKRPLVSSGSFTRPVVLLDMCATTRFSESGLTVLDGRGWARARRHDVLRNSRQRAPLLSHERYQGAAQGLVHPARRSPGRRNDIDQDSKGFIDSSEDLRRNRPDADVLQLRACWRPGR